MLRREAVVGRNQNGSLVSLVLHAGSARFQSREMCRPPHEQDVTLGCCVRLEGVAMGQKVDLQKSNNLFSRRVQFDLPKRMSQVYELREQVRLAEMAATSKQLVSRPRPVDSRTK
jgi:hypothetical protein